MLKKLHKEIILIKIKDRKRKKMNEYVFKLVESPNKKYLYDTNLHKIHMISDELYELLQNEEVENCTENTEILQMKQKGFFQPMRVKSLGNPLFSVADVYLERGLQKLTLWSYVKI